jgi:hypothetical protein
VAEDHEQRVLEREPRLAQAQRRVRGSAEVVSDHDVGRIVAQSEHDAVRVRELPWLDYFSSRHRSDLDTGVAVDTVPVRVDRAGIVLSEQDLDPMSESSERQREKGRRGAHAAGGAEAAQFVRDHGHAATRRHRCKRNVR